MPFIAISLEGNTAHEPIYRHDSLHVYRVMQSVTKRHCRRKKYIACEGKYIGQRKM